MVVHGELEVPDSPYSDPSSGKMVVACRADGMDSTPCSGSVLERTSVAEHMGDCSL